MEMVYETPRLVLRVLREDAAESVLRFYEENKEIFEKYEESVPDFDFRLKVKAGLTGYAQVYGKYNTTPIDKLKLDLTYIQEYSYRLDLKLLLLTFRIVFRKESSEGVDKNQQTALKDKNEKG